MKEEIGIVVTVLEHFEDSLGREMESANRNSMDPVFYALSFVKRLSSAVRNTLIDLEAADDSE